MKKRTYIFVMVLVGYFIINCLAPADATEIGIAWVGENPRAEKAASVLNQSFPELAPQIKVEYQKELKTQEDLAKLVKKWEQEKDAIILMGSDSGTWAIKTSPSIPTFIAATSHPTLGGLSNVERPEGNVTGVSRYVPMKTQFEIFKTILPQFKSIALVLAKNPDGDVSYKSMALKKAADELGISYKEFQTSNTEEQLAAIKKVRDTVDAIIFGSSTLSGVTIDRLLDAVGKTPIFSVSTRNIKQGKMLLGCIADDREINYMLAQSVVDVVIGGKAVKDVPVKYDTKPLLYISAKIADKQNVNIPYYMLENAKIID